MNVTVHYDGDEPTDSFRDVRETAVVRTDDGFRLDVMFFGGKLGGETETQRIQMDDVAQVTSHDPDGH